MAALHSSPTTERLCVIGGRTRSNVGTNNQSTIVGRSTRRGKQRRGLVLFTFFSQIVRSQDPALLTKRHISLDRLPSHLPENCGVHSCFSQAGRRERERVCAELVGFESFPFIFHLVIHLPSHKHASSGASQLVAVACRYTHPRCHVFVPCSPSLLLFVTPPPYPFLFLFPRLGACSAARASRT